MRQIPLHVRIEQALRARLDSTAAGDALPSEPALAAEFGVARMTVRAALNRLEADGLISRIPGRGTFARQRPTPRPAGTLMSFYEQVRGWGSEPSSRVIRAGLRPASTQETERLQLTPNAAVVAITRARLADDVPIAVEHACFPQHLADLLELDLESSSLHAALRSRGRRPTLGSSVISAEAAGPDAEWLAIGGSDPVLVEARLIVDQDAVPLEYTISRYVGARYALNVAFDVRSPPES